MITMLVTPSTNKWYLLVSATIFAVVGIGHLALIMLQTPVEIAGYAVPYELNGIVVILLGYLSTRGVIAAFRR